MKKALALLIALPIMLVAIGCTPVEQKARNTEAALNGLITPLQAQYQASCSAPANLQVNPQMCDLINRGVSAQNALATAAETYCGFAVALLPNDPALRASVLATNCVPQKNAKGLLVSATLNAGQIVLELRAAIKGGV